MPSIEARLYRSSTCSLSHYREFLRSLQRMLNLDELYFTLVLTGKAVCEFHCVIKRFALVIGGKDKSLFVCTIPYNALVNQVLNQRRIFSNHPHKFYSVLNESLYKLRQPFRNARNAMKDDF